MGGQLWSGVSLDSVQKEGKLTCYQDIYSDFPLRCKKLWTRLDQSQRDYQEDLSVTTMLVIAAAGFAMPWENLKRNNIGGNDAEWKNHPSFKGVTELDYGESLQRLNGEFSKMIAESRLTTSDGDVCWHFATCEELRLVRDVAEYEAGSMLDPRNTKVRKLLRPLRNALAHNNICGFGVSKEKIQKLAFFSEIIEEIEEKKERTGWYVLSTDIEGFRIFLDEWFKLIRNPNLRLVLSEAMHASNDLRAA